jgi:hypothetical protein
MHLGVFDVIASANHATFPQDSEIIKPLACKAFRRNIVLFYPLVLEKSVLKKSCYRGEI